MQQRQADLAVLELVIQHDRKYCCQPQAFPQLGTTSGELPDKTTYHLPFIHTVTVWAQLSARFSTTQMSSAVSKSHRRPGWLTSWGTDLTHFRKCNSLGPLPKMSMVPSSHVTDTPPTHAQILLGVWPSLRISVGGNPRKY